MRSNSFPFVLAPLRRSLGLFWHETHTKGLRTRSPARLEMKEGRKVQKKTEREVDNREQKRPFGLREQSRVGGHSQR